MDVLFLILSLGMAGGAFYMFADFLLWRRSGRVALAEIVDFQSQRNKGFDLPVVRIEAKDGKEHIVAALRIDRFAFLLNRPGKEDFIAIIYKESDPKQARVYGYINVVAGLFLLIPLCYFLTDRYGHSVAVSQLSYFVALGAIIFGGWVFLKLIQRNY